MMRCEHGRKSCVDTPERAHDCVLSLDGRDERVFVTDVVFENGELVGVSVGPRRVLYVVHNPRLPDDPTTCSVT